MSELSREDVLHVANLARLQLTDDEVNAAQRDLGKVIRYIDGLSQLKTDHVSATYGLQPRSNVLRSDQVGETLDPVAVLANAPAAEAPPHHSDEAGGARYFRIPRILE